ncbi:Spy/CpxP family protein refolding chaperone [Flavobacterium frigidarium]|uniref:Heavy-metal resistance n=1 Tax=Flavobacterium frigidarium TaxID=99286 RepID=A0ABV4K976_9FLAO
MNKIKVLTFSVIALVILNLGMILFFMIIKPREFKNQKNGSRLFIVEKLHFDEPQKKQFRVLIEQHITKIKRYESTILSTKEVLYLQLSQAKIDLKAKDSLIAVLGNMQKKVETARFEHFKAIKSICNTPQQKEDFNNLTIELAQKIGEPNPISKK